MPSDLVPGTPDLLVNQSSMHLHEMTVQFMELQKGHQYLSSNSIIEICPLGGKKQGGQRFCQEDLAIVSSTVISRSSNVRKVDLFSPWKRSKPRLLFL